MVAVKRLMPKIFSFTEAKLNVSEVVGFARVQTQVLEQDS